MISMSYAQNGPVAIPPWVTASRTINPHEIPSRIITPRFLPLPLKTIVPE